MQGEIAMERKILIGIDESDYYKNILHYVGNLFAAQPEFHIDLFSVFPCQRSESGRQLLDDQELLTVMDASTRKHYIQSKRHVQEAAEAFINAGFDAQQINAATQLSHASVVNDLLFKAKSEQYDALVVGKKDLGALAKMVSGCYSADILERCHEIPVWVINGKSFSHKLFVPVDCTPNTLNAVDHLAFILKDNPKAEIVLFHSASMLAHEEIAPREIFYDKWGKEWCDEHLQGEASEHGHFHFHAPEQMLLEAGFPMERVHRLKSEKGIEPAQMIVHHVKDGDYGTIVMGRRGKDASKGIFRGVTDRVLANVANIAVWIIG